MNPTVEDGIKAVTDAFNKAGEDFRILAQGTDTPETLLETLSPPWGEYIKEHEPWERAFVIWYENEPAQIATNFRDQWSATPNPSEGVIKRPNIYAKFGGGTRAMLPGLTYEPVEKEEAAIELEVHPIEGREDLFRTVASNKSPIPDIKLQVWDIGVDQPAIDAGRHFNRGESIHVLETGEEGSVRGTTGRTVSVSLPERDENFSSFRPSEIEQVSNQ